MVVTIGISFPFASTTDARVVFHHLFICLFIRALLVAFFSSSFLAVLAAYIVLIRNERLSTNVLFYLFDLETFQTYFVKFVLLQEETTVLTPNNRGDISGEGGGRIIQSGCAHACNYLN